MPFCSTVSADDFGRESRELSSTYVQMLESRCQSALDRTFESHGGQPVEIVEPELVRQWRIATGGGDTTQAQLSAYAEAISAGRKIKVQDYEP